MNAHELHHNQLIKAAIDSIWTTLCTLKIFKMELNISLFPIKMKCCHLRSLYFPHLAYHQSCSDLKDSAYEFYAFIHNVAFLNRNTDWRWIEHWWTIKTCCKILALLEVNIKKREKWEKIFKKFEPFFLMKMGSGKTLHTLLCSPCVLLFPHYLRSILQMLPCM